MRTASSTRRHDRGLTVLEIMIVLAIIGLLSYLAYSGFRVLSSAALVEDTNDVAAILRRTQALAAESGEPVRVVIDLDRQRYWVEACVGSSTLVKSEEEQAVDPESVKQELERAAERVRNLPAGQLQAEDASGIDAKLAALAGQKIGGRVCHPLHALPPEIADEMGSLFSGDAMGRGLERAIQTARGVKVKEVWVQHLEDSVTTGRVSISFFPLGWAEKAIIELGDGRSAHGIYLHGLTGRVEIKDGEVRNPDDHLLRNAKGETEEER